MIYILFRSAVEDYLRGIGKNEREHHNFHKVLKKYYYTYILPYINSVTPVKQKHPKKRKQFSRSPLPFSSSFTESEDDEATSTNTSSDVSSMPSALALSTPHNLAPVPKEKAMRFELNTVNEISADQIWVKAYVQSATACEEQSDEKNVHNLNLPTPSNIFQFEGFSRTHEQLHAGQRSFTADQVQHSFNTFQKSSQELDVPLTSSQEAALTMTVLATQITHSGPPRDQSSTNSCKRFRRTKEELALGLTKQEAMDKRLEDEEYYH